MLKLNQFHILLSNKNECKTYCNCCLYKPGKYAFQFAERFLQLNKREFPAKWQKEVIQHDGQVSCNWKDKLQTLKKNSCKRTKGYLWLNTNDSCEWNARVLEKMFAERIHVVGQKIFLHLDWKDSCNGAEWAPAFAERICVVGQKGFLLEEESLHR